MKIRTLLSTNALWPRCASVGVLLLAAAGPASESNGPVPIDYAAEFAKNFPAASGEYKVVDWDLYSALVKGDIVSYAAKLDPIVAKHQEHARGKGYQMQELEAGITQDKRLRASFDEQRRRIASMVLYVDGNGATAERCQHRLVYMEKEFRLILGGIPGNADPLTSATVGPSCPPYLNPNPGLQITAGHSRRFKCWEGWDGVIDRTCGWRLPDMPDVLKRVIEDAYPTTINLRWRWRGLGGTTRVRYLDSNGNRVSEHDSLVVTTPVDLGLEFVDDKGQILWTAEAGRLGGSAPLGQRPLHAEERL
jgi:hypothetical protein